MYWHAFVDMEQKLQKKYNTAQIVQIVQIIRRVQDE